MKSIANPLLEPTRREAVQLVGQLAGQLAGHLAGQLTGQLTGQLANYTGQLAGQLAGQLTGQLAGKLSGKLAGQLAGPECQMLDETIWERSPRAAEQWNLNNVEGRAYPDPKRDLK